MTNELTYYIDRLSDGRSEDVDISLAPSFLEVEDNLLKFTDSVNLQGQVYLANDHLIIQLKIRVKYEVSCKICNSPIKKDLHIKGAYFTEDIKNIRSKVYDAEPLIRDAILLEVPLYQECDGECPFRETFQKFMK